MWSQPRESQLLTAGPIYLDRILAYAQKNLFRALKCLSTAVLGHVGRRFCRMSNQTTKNKKAGTSTINSTSSLPLLSTDRCRSTIIDDATAVYWEYVKCNSISVFSIECGKLLSDQIFPRQVFPGITNLLHRDKCLRITVEQHYKIRNIKCTAVYFRDWARWERL